MERRKRMSPQKITISRIAHQISRRENPPPTSSSSLPPKIPPLPATIFPKSIRPISPLLGAFGLEILLLFSCPALLGKVGNISFAFGFGSSLK